MLKLQGMTLRQPARQPINPKRCVVGRVVLARYVDLFQGNLGCVYPATNLETLRLCFEFNRKVEQRRAVRSISGLKVHIALPMTTGAAVTYTIKKQVSAGS